MLWYERFLASHREQFPHITIEEQAEMKGFTTLRVGGPARIMAFPKTVEECVTLLEGDWPTLVIGKGSNLLVSDKGLDCLVINTCAMDTMERRGETTLYAEAGCLLSRLAVFAMGESLSGLAFAHGIPGTLGGAVFMNAGAYGGEMCQVVSRVGAYLPGQGLVTFTGEELQFGYRCSRFSRLGGIVLWAELTLTPGDKDAVKGEMEDYRRRRQERQPLNYPSAGSTFKRPEGHYAGALIEQCGLKGFTVGGAQVSEKHAGFVINTGSATAEDVMALIRSVQDTVFEKTGVHLEPEVRLLGTFSE